MGQTQECQSLDNQMILCACGCGQSRPRYDKRGRVRHFLPGHQHRKIGDINKILNTVNNLGTPSLAGKTLGLSRDSIRKLLQRNGKKYENDLSKVGGNTAFGRKAELKALELLPGAIDTNQNNPHESPFDLLWNGQRIDVKASTLKDGGNNSFRWSFKTGKPEKCDMFLCLGYGAENVLSFALLVPSMEAPSCLSIPVSMESKWMRYLI